MKWWRPQVRSAPHLQQLDLLGKLVEVHRLALEGGLARLHVIEEARQLALGVAVEELCELVDPGVAVLREAAPTRESSKRVRGRHMGERVLAAA